MRRSFRIASLLLVCALPACEAEPWLQLAGMHAFREVDTPEARRMLGDPGGLVLQLRTTRLEPRLPEAIVLEVDDPLPESVPLGTSRILVVTPDAAEGRRLSARLVRAGARRVALVVEDPIELGAPRSPLLARPVEP